MAKLKLPFPLDSIDNKTPAVYAENIRDGNHNNDTQSDINAELYEFLKHTNEHDIYKNANGQPLIVYESGKLSIVSNTLDWTNSFSMGIENNELSFLLDNVTIDEDTYSNLAMTATPKVIIEDTDEILNGNIITVTGYDAQNMTFDTMIVQGNFGNYNLNIPVVDGISMLVNDRTNIDEFNPLGSILNLGKEQIFLGKPDIFSNNNIIDGFYLTKGDYWNDVGLSLANFVFDDEGVHLVPIGLNIERNSINSSTIDEYTEATDHSNYIRITNGVSSIINHYEDWHYISSEEHVGSENYYENATYSRKKGISCGFEIPSDNYFFGIHFYTHTTNEENINPFELVNDLHLYTVSQKIGLLVNDDILTLGTTSSDEVLNSCFIKMDCFRGAIDINLNEEKLHLDYDKLKKLDNLLNEWIGTQAKYDALTTKDPNITYYIID